MDIIVKVDLEVLFANEGQVEKTLNTGHIGIVGPGRDPHFMLADRLITTLARAIQDQAEAELKLGDRLILSIPQTAEAIMILDPRSLFSQTLNFFYQIRR